jgi:hypothetical protein
MVRATLTVASEFLRAHLLTTYQPSRSLFLYINIGRRLCILVLVDRRTACRGATCRGQCHDVQYDRPPPLAFAPYGKQDARICLKQNCRTDYPLVRAAILHI